MAGAQRWTEVLCFVLFTISGPGFAVNLRWGNTSALPSEQPICRLYNKVNALKQAKNIMAVMLESTITCPECGREEKEQMPEDACQFFYECKGCGVLLRPLKGDCCVFCSFGDITCPPIQQKKTCCRS